MRRSKRRRRGRGEEEEGRGGWVDEGMHHSDERVRRPCTRARAFILVRACIGLAKKSITKRGVLGSYP